ncbi:hypothetical protein NYE59_23780 [Paenibacillus sp. FSL L8-0323]|uniref:hypothetical protein n=1 Tax=Paenibacillus sp. FSL L8-0323 TaxID=2975330 RepID=UPI0030FB08E8
MKNKLLRFYKENVSVEALVNSRIKEVYRFFSVSFWVFIVSVFSLLITYLMFISGLPQPFAISLLAILLSAIALLVAISMYFRRARAVIRVDLKLPLKEKTGRWRTEDFNDYQRKMILDFIKENKLDKKWKIEKVITSLTKDKESLTVQPLIAPAVFISLMIPIVNQLLTFLLANYKANSIEIFVYAVLFTISITIIANTFKKQFGSLREELYKNYYHRRDLIDILEDILLSFEE